MIRITRMTVSAVLALSLAASAAGQQPPGADAWRGPAAIGVAVEDDAGKPVAGATVQLRHAALPPSAAPPPLLTDARGRAVAGHLAEGEWLLEVSHPGFMLFTAQLEARAGKAAKSKYASQVSTGTSWAAMRVDLFRVRDMPPPLVAGAVAAPPPAPAPTVAPPPSAAPPAPAAAPPATVPASPAPAPAPPPAATVPSPAPTAPASPPPASRPQAATSPAPPATAPAVPDPLP